MATRNCNGIPAVGYARRSTDMQERSIPDQKAFIESWAAENGYRIVRWYVDDAISGTSTRDRDAFAQLIQAAENGRDFETILCYDMARFSRRHERDGLLFAPPQAGRRQRAISRR